MAALADVVVLEFATGVAGPYCGKLLADLGAQVIKVEPPSGDPLRAEPPLHAGESAFFNYLNAGKRSVVFEPTSDEVLVLAARADIVIHNLNGHGIDAFDSELRSR
ncbi:MAG TPA: CoA transferase, partial [Tepidiformaceae bacterium]|nr:CoA transferase [Tepidiformaceae bacterium]